MKSASPRGFTLLEMLVALAIFALIATVCYVTLVPAGEGFRMLQQQRDVLESSYQMDRRLRMDTTYIMRSADKSLISLEITHDQRGSDAFDTLSLLVGDGDALAPELVHYAIDEAGGEIVRQSAMAWLRDAQPVVWRMQKASSFEVQALAPDGQWVDTWDKARKELLPSALRVRWREGEAGVQRELWLPLPVARPAQGAASSSTTPAVQGVPSDGTVPAGTGA